DAHRRRAVPAAHRRAGRAPRRDPGVDQGRRAASVTTYLGMPGAAPTAPRGVGQLRGSEPFPVAARRALADSQLRRNLGNATATIRAKRAAAVAELPDWEELREAGRAIKAETMRHLDTHLL